MNSAEQVAPAAPSRSLASHVLEDGFFAGVIGAGLVALWYLVLDLAGGRPLYTPSLLGSVLFKGATDLAVIPVEPQVVAWYTAVHFLVFLGVGMVASWLATQFDRFPTVGVAILFLFVIFETGFFIFAFTVGRAVLGTLGLWTIAVANLLAAAGMALYLLRRHPMALRNMNRIWTDQE
jgi:hypothetical protein